MVGQGIALGVAQVGYGWQRLGGRSRGDIVLRRRVVGSGVVVIFFAKSLGIHL